MLQFLTAFALANTPAPMDPSSLPVFPEMFVGRIHELCVAEMISDAAGRLEVLGVRGCEEHFADAVRDRLSWMTWQTPPPFGDEGPLESSYAMLTGVAGAPGGLYVRFGVRFERKGDEVARVEVVPVEVISPKKAGKLGVSTDYAEEIGEECVLLAHVDESGRTERVQAQTCSEAVRSAVELPLMAWTWRPLVVDGRPRAFAATFRFTPDRLMDPVAD